MFPATFLIALSHNPHLYRVDVHPQGLRPCVAVEGAHQQLGFTYLTDSNAETRAGFAKQLQLRRGFPVMELTRKISNMDKATALKKILSILGKACEIGFDQDLFDLRGEIEEMLTTGSEGPVSLEVELMIDELLDYLDLHDELNLAEELEKALTIVCPEEEFS